MRHHAPLILLALSACEFYSDDIAAVEREDIITDALPVDAPDYADLFGFRAGTGSHLRDPSCDPVIRIPRPQNTLDMDVLPDEHAERFGRAPTPKNLHLSWPGANTARSIAMVWATDVLDDTDEGTFATMVEWGTDGLTNQTEGRSWVLVAPTADRPGTRIHEVRMCGTLEPGTTYRYRAGGPGNWSPEYSFTTPELPRTFDSFTVAVMGDSRGSYEKWSQLINAADAYDPDFFMFSGDAVEFGTNQHEWDAWFGGAKEVLARKVLVPAHGNHEFLAVNYFAQWALPNNEAWFHIDYGPLRVVSLNDTFMPFEMMESTQVRYMDDVFGTSQAPWHFAMHHVPIYSTCTRHRSYELLRDVWEPVFERQNVDMVFAGHNHIYERSQPIRDGRTQQLGRGTLYIVTGGAGAPLYREADVDWFQNIANPVEHFMIGTFDSEGVSWVVRDISGNVIDDFRVPKN